MNVRFKVITAAIMMNTIFWNVMLYCLVDSTNDVEGPTVSSVMAACHHNPDNVCTNTRSQTRIVILAKHWLQLPDDGSCVNRNMLERLL